MSFESFVIAWTRDWIAMTILLVLMSAFFIFMVVLGRRDNDTSGAILGSFLFLIVPIIAIFLSLNGKTPTLKELSFDYMNGEIDKSTLEKLIPYAISLEKEQREKEEAKRLADIPKNALEKKRREEFNAIVSRYTQADVGSGVFDKALQ